MRYGFFGMRFLLCLVLGIILLLLCSCSRLGDYARERADKAAYKIIAQKQSHALGRADDITIDPIHGQAFQKVLEQAPRQDWARDYYTTPAYTLSLNDALAIGITNNRDYKTQKESLYTQALSLTEVRRNFQPLFSGSVDGGVSRVEQDGEVEWYGARGFSGGVSKALATGARISLDFSHSFIRYFTNDPRPAASNTFSASFMQPLLRGAGRLVAHENLRQAERSMIYNVRSFRRYQQGFIIDVMQRYYSLLSAQDQLKNEQGNYEKTVYNWQKLENFAKGGKATEVQVDQARQEVLRAESRISRTQASFGRQLDSFKIFLGLPIDLDMGPDPEELDILQARGLLRPDMTLKDAVNIALEERLDLKNQKDQVEDNRRGVRIAFRNFFPHLDFNYKYSTSTGDDKDRIKLDFEDNTHEFSLNLGLPFDWTPRRNDYRRALISLTQAERSLEEFEEKLVLDVRDAWRKLEQSRVDYKIQQESVRLSERRVEMAALFLQSGRSTARDLLEAQEELLSSKNALTTALVQYTIQRLQFWNAIDRMEIDEKGMWVENPEQ